VAKILIVEDPLVGRMIDGIVSRDGYTAIQAEGKRATDLLNDETAEIGLLVTNNPAQFPPASRNVPLLYVAASPEPERAAMFAHCRTLTKPFRPRDLLALTHDLLAP
jgi:DNA-binding response OmpR family regulator